MGPDGARLASGTQTVIKLWEIEDGKLLRKIEAAGANLAWSPDGKTLAASYSSGIVTLYELETGKPLKSLPAGTYAYSLRYLPKDGALVVLNYTTMTQWKDGSESSVKMFDLGGQSPVFWTPGRPMVAGIGEKNLILWQAGIGRRIATLEGHAAAVTVVAWSRDGKQLASGGADGKIIIWDGATGKRLTTMEGNAGHVLSLSWSPEGKQIASGATDQNVNVWDAATGKKIRTLPEHGAAVYAVAWSPSGKLLAAGGMTSWCGLGYGEEAAAGAEGSPLRPPWRGRRAGGCWPAAGRRRAAALGRGGGEAGHDRQSGDQPAVTHVAWAPNDGRSPCLADLGRLSL